MANLTSSLLTTTGALDTYSQALAVVQNNVAYASTPDYASQTLSLDPLEFDPTTGYPGGVRAGQVESSRNEYAEQAVQQKTTLLGQAQQDVNSLTAIQTLFDVTGGSGISATFNNLFSAFSSWGQSPDSPVAQQNVMQGAASVAAAFQQTAAGLTKVAQSTSQQLQSTVDQVNQIAAQLAGFSTKAATPKIQRPPVASGYRAVNKISTAMPYGVTIVGKASGDKDSSDTNGAGRVMAAVADSTRGSRRLYPARIGCNVAGRSGRPV